MTVKELIDKIKDFDPKSQITTVHEGDNPISDYSSVIDAYEIRGANRDGINGIVLVTD